MEQISQGNTATLVDVDLNEQVRNICIESILTLLHSVNECGGEPLSTNVYVEEDEYGILGMRMRFRLPELGSITIPLMKVGPLYWCWNNGEEEH
jgi:hypothetical protein